MDKKNDPNYIQIVNQHGAHMGWWKCGQGFLPTFIWVDDRLYQRYGSYPDNRYVAEPSVYEPEAHTITKD